MNAVTIKTADLKAAVKRLKPAYQRRGKIPILSHTLVSVAPGAVEFVQTNLDLEIHHTAEATADAEFAFTLDYKLLARLAALDCEALTFTVTPGKDADKLTVSSDGFSLSVNLLCQAVDFPLMPEARLAAFNVAKTTTLLAASGINRLLRLSAHCISTEETRYYLNGVYLCKSPDATLRAVSTDGHRLARIDSTVAWAGPEVILPTEAVKALLRETAGNVTMSLCDDPHLAVFAGDGWTYRVKLIDGKYPNYAKVIPEEGGAISAVISAAQIKRLMAVPEYGFKSVFVAMTAGQMSAKSDDRSISVTIPAQATGPDGFITGFNRKYLAAQARVTPTFRLTSKGSNEPARIVGDDPLALFVLMPVLSGHLK